MQFSTEWIQNSEKQNSECYKTAKLQKGEITKKTNVTKQRKIIYFIYNIKNIK